MRLAVNLAVLAAVNVLMAFAVQWYVVTMLGAAQQTDALFAGLAIPTVVLSIITGSVMHVLVPLLAGEEKASLKADAWTLFSIAALVFAILFAILYLTAPIWVLWLVPGFDAEAQALTLELTRIQLVGMLFTGINGVQVAVYHAKGKFVWPQIAPLASAVLTFAALVYALPEYGVMAVAWLNVLRVALLTLLLGPGMGRPTRPNFTSLAVQESWARIKPLLLGSAYYKTDVLVDRALLSLAVPGTLTLYYLAQRIYDAAGQVFNQALCAPAVPVFAEHYKRGDLAALRHVFYRKLQQVGLISGVLILLLLVIGQPTMLLVRNFGAFDEASVQGLWVILCLLAGMFFGSGTGQICASTFYAMGDTITPTRLSVITYTVYVPSKIAAFWLFGLTGLALATSVYYLCNLALQIYLLERRFRHDVT